jgi:diguanylate cyclase (GGDEF)-like protein/PAS domain S-box-containing protein
MTAQPQIIELARRAPAAAQAGSEVAHADYVGLFAEAIALPIAAWDAQLRLIWCNGAYERFARRPQAQLLGQDIRSIYGESIHAIAAPAYQRAFAGQQATFDRLVTHHGGSPRWHRIQVVPAIDAAGQVTHVYSTAIDIDDDVRGRAALAEAEQKVRRMLAAVDLPIGCWEWDAAIDEPRLVMVNQPYLRWARRSESELLGRTLRENYGDDAWSTARPAFLRALRAESCSYDRVVRHQEKEHWVRVAVFPELGADEQVRAVYTIAYTIDEEVRAIEELRASRRRLDRFTMRIPYPLTYFDQDLRYRFVNQAFCSRHGLDPQDVVGKTIVEVRGATVWAEYRPLIERALAGEEVSYEREVRLADGRLRWTRSTYVPDWAEDPVTGRRQVEGVYSTSIDIHEIKSAQLALKRAAEVDPLTDAYNRRHLMRALDDACRQVAHAPFVLFFVDLDGFKQVNDQAGHHAGDVLLVNVAHALRQAAGPHALIGRYGGDEFVVLAWIEDRAQIESLAARLLHAAAQPVPFGSGAPLQVSASVGAVRAEGPHADARNLLKRADDAMYRAKREGRNRWLLG